MADRHRSRSSSEDRFCCCRCCCRPAADDVDCLICAADGDVIHVNPSTSMAEGRREFPAETENGWQTSML